MDGALEGSARTDIDDVHWLVDEVEFEIRKLGRDKRKQIDVLDDSSDLCLILGDVVGWGAGSRSPGSRLGRTATGSRLA